MGRVENLEDYDVPPLGIVCPDLVPIVVYDLCPALYNSIGILTELSKYKHKAFSFYKKSAIPVFYVYYFTFFI